MTVLAMKTLILGLLFVLAMLSGLLISRIHGAAKTIIFTIHKILAVAALVLAMWTFWPLLYSSQLSSFAMWVMVSFEVVSLVLIITGGVLSVVKSAPKLFMYLHQFLPVLGILCYIILLTHIFTLKI